MNENMKCSDCNSDKLMQNIRIVDHGYMDSKHDLAIELEGKPDALIFKDTRKSVLKATICGNCGRVNLSVDNPKDLWEIYNKK